MKVGEPGARPPPVAIAPGVADIDTPFRGAVELNCRAPEFTRGNGDPEDLRAIAGVALTRLTIVFGYICTRPSKRMPRVGVMKYRRPAPPVLTHVRPFNE